MKNLAAQVSATKKNAAAARVLAGAADRDVTAIRDELRDVRRATTVGINTLRQDMTDERDDLISHLLAVLSKHLGDRVLFIGGDATTLGQFRPARTDVPEVAEVINLPTGVPSRSPSYPRSATPGSNRIRRTPLERNDSHQGPSGSRSTCLSMASHPDTKRTS